MDNAAGKQRERWWQKRQRPIIKGGGERRAKEEEKHAKERGTFFGRKDLNTANSGNLFIGEENGAEKSH